MLMTSPDRLSGRTAAPPPPRHPPIGQRSPEPQPGLVRGVDGSASTAIMSCPASALSHESYHACTHQIWSPRAISAHPDPARQPFASRQDVREAATGCITKDVRE